MATPNVLSLTLFSTLPITGAQMNANETQTVNWMADGTADFNINSVTLISLLNLPKLTTTQINALANMVEGSVVWDSTLHVPKCYNGSAWKTITIS